MTLGGWINLILSVGVVVTLLAWCIWKLLYGGSVPPPPEDREILKKPFER